MNNINRRKVYIETYGCQMNLNDSEIASTIILEHGYELTDNPEKADIILLNTCSVRDNAERKIVERLKHLKRYKKAKRELVVGVIGCMAERLQDKIFDDNELVNIVVGPDEYRTLPHLLDNTFSGEKGIAVKLSTVETYDNIIPLRTNGISAWLSIMRGCNNFCSYCVVPYTRGRERSRSMNSILDEIKYLQDNNFNEVTLLGQNVNSYWNNENEADFSDLLAACAKAAPQMRIRFMTSHPRDMSDKLIQTMSEHPEICKHIHLPLQSGSARILNLMKRKYTFTHYLSRINKIKEIMPDCSLTTDIIAGFPTETEDDHRLTLAALQEIGFDGAFMFKYSPREGTSAFKQNDDIPEEEKIRRLNEIIDLQHSISGKLNKQEIGRTYEVLAEGPSKRNPEEWMGRNTHNKVVIFKINNESDIIPGSIVNVKITRTTSATLFGEIEDY